MEDLTDSKINKLLILNGVQLPKNKGKYAFLSYLCKCDCGKIKEISVYQLKKNIQSCGCAKILANISTQIKSGDKFGRLTVIGFDLTKQVWEYKCECGKSVFVDGKRVRRGVTKSCGCLNLEKNLEKAINMININSNLDPIKTISNRVYGINYADGDLDLNTFFNLSQLPCHYCGASKTNTRTKTPSQHSYLSKLSTEDLTYRYNGLDRINSDLPHNIDNCVPSCYICNHAKSDMKIENFLIYLQKLTTYKNNLSVNEYRKLSSHIDISFFDNTKKHFSLISSINSIYIRRYNDIDFDLKTFYQLSQLNCYYCGTEPLNLTNRAKQKTRASEYAIATGDFRYNGLDRLDPNFPHIYENIVPACYRCNFAKNKLTLDDFRTWVKRIKDLNTKT